MNRFTLKHTTAGSKARAGAVHTDHGDILTPIFMPVGTRATVKNIHQQELEQTIKAQIILGNTYHLYLRPGMEIMQGAGGLHEFMHWRKPILTDSGGYQIYSLSHRRKMTEDGATFSSHIDGSKHFFSPENTMAIQKTIGADIMMAFDECTPYPCTEKYARKSMHLTHRWLDRSIAAHQALDAERSYHQILAPIVQGSVYPHLRQESAEYIAAKDAELNAIGGLSVGEPAPDMYAMADLVTEILPVAKPRYLMGVGTPANLLECIDRGIDMFDCVLPTRNARHGLIYTTRGIINIKNAKWKSDFTPLDAALDLKTSQTHSKAYMRHLFSVGEALGAQLATLQNLRFYLWLMETAREHILADTFSSWKADTLAVITRRL